MVLSSLLRTRALRNGAVLFFLVSLLCTRIPLLNYLGYEFSAVIALVASVFSGFLSLNSTKQKLATTEVAADRPASGMETLKSSLATCVVLLLIPLTVMSANGFFVRNCSLLQGLALFVLIPAVSVVFSVALGFFCAVYFPYPRTAFILLSLGTLGYAVALGYYTPAIYSYNFFYGYFPGITYDEGLELGWTLVIFRGLTLLVAAALVESALVVLRSAQRANSVWEKTEAFFDAIGRTPLVYPAVGTGLVLILAFLYRNELGFESHSTLILRTLDRQWTAEHFTIHYSHTSYSDEEIEWVGAEHEFQLHQILSMMSLPFHGKIESYVYPSSEAKQRLIGAGQTNIAKPWSNEIHITKQSLDATLEHELVHIVAAPFGIPVVRASMSPGLTEGLAMAVEKVWGNRTLHQYAAALYRFGLAPPIREILSFTGFFSQSSSVSYVLAGSFCRFLIDRYGIRNMMRVYGRGGYRTVYGRSLDELIAEWQGYLGRLVVTDAEKDAIDVFFRRPPIFRKVCARVLANRMSEASQRSLAKEYTTASTLYREAFEDGRGFEALSGYLGTALRLHRFDVLTSALDTIVMNDPLPTRFLPLFLNIGDAMWANGMTEKAEEMYSRLVAANITDPLTEAAGIRIHSLRDHAVGDRLLSYFVGDLNDTLRFRMLDSTIHDAPDDWIPRFLQARVLQRLNRLQDALTLVQSSGPIGQNAHLEAFRLRMEGYVLFRLKRFQDSKIPFWHSLNYYSTEGAQEFVHEWVDRCDWMSMYPLP